MNKIRILDEKTINQIAAGEVIENPASVVKELVDNALDAGASKIMIEATNSGRQTIRVQDDGCGMSYDDALLSLERHATSKIRSLNDLWNLSTMGFRGEALSSIASVSELRLLTNVCKSNEQGTAIQVVGGKITSHEKVQCLPGTDIEVRSLFFNVPARKKFLKSPAKDANDILKLVSQLALANPQVGFELLLNHKRELSFSKQESADRIKATLGQQFFLELIPVDYQSDTVQIQGYIGKPEYSRPTRSHQYLFVNRRPVASLLISQAVKSAYGTSIDASRHPTVVLFITIQAELIDVNVHPQKKEVRFSLEEEINQAITAAIVSRLFSMPRKEISFQAHSAPYAALQTQQFSHIVRPAPLEITQTSFEEAHAISTVLTVIAGYIIVEIHWPETLKSQLPEDLDQDGLYVIKASTALARITFEGAENGKDVAKGHIQTLLVPIFIELSAHDTNQMRLLMPKLLQAGVMVREFGATSFLIEGIPSYLEEVDVEQVIRNLLDAEPLMNELPNSLAKIAANTYSRYSFTKEQAAHIVRKLLNCRQPFRCPFGGQTVSIITKKELEKKFQ